MESHFSGLAVICWFLEFYLESHCPWLYLENVPVFPLVIWKSYTETFDTFPGDFYQGWKDLICISVDRACFLCSIYLLKRVGFFFFLHFKTALLKIKCRSCVGQCSAPPSLWQLCPAPSVSGSQLSTVLPQPCSLSASSLFWLFGGLLCFCVNFRFFFSISANINGILIESLDLHLFYTSIFMMWILVIHKHRKPYLFGYESSL